MNKVDDILEKLKNAEQPQIDLTEEIMESLTPRPLQGERGLKRSVLWPYAISAIAAGIVLLLVFHFSQEPIKQEPVVAEVVEQQPAPEASDYSESSDNSEFSEPVKPKRIDKTRKVSKPVEEPLLAEAEPVTETLVKDNYEERLSDPSNPYLLATAQLQDLRSRGERLDREVAMLMQH